MIRLLTLFFLVIFLACQNQTETSALIEATNPKAEKIDFVHSKHGVDRLDPYQWLSDRNNPEVIEYLESENANTEKMMAPTEKMQKDIYEEMIARIEQKYESLPTKSNGYWYYSRYEEGNDYPYYCRKKGDLLAKEEIILDVNQMAKGHEIYRLFQYFVSPDNQTVAFLVDTLGDRRNTLYFKDLNTGDLLPEQISNCSYSGAFSSDGNYFFYTQNDHTVRSYQVKRHQMGKSVTSDQKIFEESDNTFTVNVQKSSDKKLILIGSFSTTTSECWFLKADEPTADATVVQPRRRDLLYSVDSYTGEEILHVYNNDQALNFKISTTNYQTPALDNWKDLVTHQPDVYINGFTVKKNYLVVQERNNALDKIRIINRQTNEDYQVDFGEEAYTASMYDATDEFNSDSIRFNYSSLTTPRSTFAYVLSNKKQELLKQQQVGGNFDATQYETKRIWAPARDGVEIPISLVYRKDLFKKNGKNPCLQYAYGSYGASSMPNFNSRTISLLDRGFVYAIAHIRGGQEMGRQWYEDGKLFKKKNTFTDFIDCSEYLIKENYTAQNNLFAMGTSAGGMLMGAITNMRPDLYKGIIARVPWMDVITDMLNADLPLTTLEYDEWGNPNDKAYHDYMLSWSPYDNVEKADYPAIFATGGLNDTQVPYFSPAKWVQKIRDNNTGDSPVLFKCNMGAGHGGASGRFQSQKEWAMLYAFMVNEAEFEAKN